MHFLRRFNFLPIDPQGSLTWVVATEILPVRSKRWTHTISNVTSNFWWFVVTKTFREMGQASACGSCAPFFLYAAVCAFGFVFIYVFLPETHNKSAEETATDFRGLSPALHRVPCCCSAVEGEEDKRLNARGSVGGVGGVGGGEPATDAGNGRGRSSVQDEVTVVVEAPQSTSADAISEAVPMAERTAKRQQ